ncbi:uncharacterized protein LOC142589706 [Dermacentor variabilis]|uniref:uncharacterized protein LOC142589706 n=1 Tax=Dermacentor variabilis TaxID=34621 RepID=UPI003F5B90AF
MSQAVHVARSQVLAKDSSAIGKSPSRPLDVASKSESRSRSSVASRWHSGSYVGEHDQAPATPRDHTTEFEPTWDIPHIRSTIATEPMGRQHWSRYHSKGVTKTGYQKKPPSKEVGNGFKIDHRAPTVLAVAGGQRAATARGKDQDKEPRRVPREEQKRRGSKSSGGSSVKSSTSSARRQRKHSHPETLPAVDSVKPSASGNPVMTSTYHAHMEAAAGAAPPAIVTATASTAATPTRVNAALAARKDATKVRDDERSSRKSQARRSQRSKSKGQVSTASCTATPVFVRDATGELSAAARSPALPTAIAASAASFGGIAPKAAVQEPVRPAVTSLRDRVTAENVNAAMPSKPWGWDSLPSSASHPPPASITTITASSGMEDVYKTGKASRSSSVAVERTSKADKDAASGAVPASVPVFAPLTTGRGRCAATAPGITGTDTNSLVAAPDLRSTAPSSRARTSAGKKGLT